MSDAHLQSLGPSVGVREELARTILATAMDGFLAMDRQGRIADANEAACRMLGYTREEMLKLTLRDIEAEESPDQTACHLERILEAGSDSFETKHRCKDGRIIDVEISTTWQPAFQRILGFMRDITQRKRAEEERQRALEKLTLMESIVNRGPVMLFLWRIAPGAWPVDLVSDNVERVLGYTADELTSGRVAWSAITHPDDVPRLEAEVSRYLAEGLREWSNEYRLYSKSGEIRWIRDWNRVVGDAAGAITHVQAIAIDITQHKQAEEALASAHQMLTAFLEAVPDLLFAIDGDFRVLYTNSRNRDLADPSDAERYRTCHGRFRLLDAPCPDCAARVVFETGRIVTCEMASPADGRRCEVRVFPVRDEAGQVTAVVKHVRNISDSKPAECDPEH